MERGRATLRRALAPAALLCLSAGLALYGLGTPRLWEDEAETALLARSILAHGLPLARVGNDLISQEEGQEFGADLIWRWTPWLDKYVAAGSFLVFGEGTRAARLPFAMLGLGAVASVYGLALGLFRDRRVAVLSMAFLGTSVPFLLHVRQCRYYVLVILGTSLAVQCATAAARRPGIAAPLGLVAAATVVFHANFLAFAALAVALPAALFALEVDRAGWNRLLLAGALVALLWCFYRYSVGLLPLFAVLSAGLAIKAWSLNRITGGVFAALLLVTGVFHELSLQPFRTHSIPDGPTLRALDWGFPLGNLLVELAHPFEGAMGSITDYLAANARPRERVLISFGDLPARFYLVDQEVRGGDSGEDLEHWPLPEWIVVRRFFRFANTPIKSADAQRMSDWLDDSVPWREYQTIDLPEPDLPWLSIPEPQLHWFRPPTAGETARIFHRRTSP